MKRCSYRKTVLKNLVEITRKHSEVVVQRCSVKKGVLRNFAKFTENTFARASFLRKLQASALVAASEN